MVLNPGPRVPVIELFREQLSYSPGINMADGYQEEDDGSDVLDVSIRETPKDGTDNHADTASSHFEDSYKWDRQVEYVLACCGFVSGIDNLFHFPYLASKYGGGAFFMIYLVLTFICGFPLLYMEMILGQYARGGPLTAWGVIPFFKGKILKNNEENTFICGFPLLYMEMVLGQYARGGPLTAWGLGLSIMLISMTISVYYNLFIAWSLHYLFTTLRSVLPWLCSTSDINSCQNTSYISSSMDQTQFSVITAQHHNVSSSPGEMDISNKQEFKYF
ncbi:hypothetical protein KUTeg_024829 [Tegillarca granosa]|uniref:Transporter n=1 Tax=Tegillarca granosa TaxID=220873 RepID=A0ABQ9DYG1_TEGGR|nr:hypothetical protein KUTeg_024829 [Tegillarca granosa]